jgi:hypothetical protein
MLSTAKNLVTGAVKTVTGGSDRSAAAEKAAATRKAQAAKRSAAAKKAAETRKSQADKRSASAKRAARTRKQRDDRVAAMRDATRRD